MLRPRQKEAKSLIRSPVSAISGLNESMTKSKFEFKGLHSRENTPVQVPSVLPPHSGVTRSGRIYGRKPSLIQEEEEISSMRAAPEQSRSNRRRAARHKLYDEGDASEFSGHSVSRHSKSRSTSQLARASTSQDTWSRRNGSQDHSLSTHDRSLRHLYGLDHHAEDDVSNMAEASMTDRVTMTSDGSDAESSLRTDISVMSDATSITHTDDHSTASLSSRISEAISQIATTCYTWFEGSFLCSVMFSLLLLDLQLLNWTSRFRKCLGGPASILLIIFLPALLIASYCIYLDQPVGSLSDPGVPSIQVTSTGPTESEFHQINVNDSHPIGIDPKLLQAHLLEHEALKAQVAQLQSQVTLARTTENINHPPGNMNESQPNGIGHELLQAHLLEHKALKAQVTQLQSQVEVLQQQEAGLHQQHMKAFDIHQQLTKLAERVVNLEAAEQLTHDRLQQLSRLMNASSHVAENGQANISALVVEHVERLMQGYVEQVWLSVRKTLVDFSEINKTREVKWNRTVESAVMLVMSWMHEHFVEDNALEARLEAKTAVLQVVMRDDLKAAVQGVKDEVMEMVRRYITLQAESGENLKDATGTYLAVSEIESLIDESLALFAADRTGLADYALESSGGSIVTIRNTETFGGKAALMSLFGIPLWYSGHSSPRAILQADVLPGHCWAFRGSLGAAVIKLSRPVRPTTFTMEHIPEGLSPDGNIMAAPREFTVWGLGSEVDESGHLLGNYTYVKDPVHAMQQFTVQAGSEQFFRYIEVKIHSNHGNIEYTCVYRFRVHGSLHG